MESFCRDDDSGNLWEGIRSARILVTFTNAGRPRPLAGEAKDANSCCPRVAMMYAADHGNGNHLAHDRRLDFARFG